MKFKLFLQWMIGLLVLTLLVSCGKDSVKSAVVAADNTVKFNEIMKTWEADCQDSTILSASNKVYYKFFGSKVMKNTDYFTADDCTSPSFNTRYEGNFKLPNKSDLGKNAYNIDIEYTIVSLVPLTKVGVELMNLSHVCGISNWELGKRQELTVESQNALCPVSKVPQLLFDIIEVDDKKLYLGSSDDADMQTIDSRALAFDKALPFNESKHDMN